MAALARSEWLHRHPEMPHRDLDHFGFMAITRIVPLLRVAMCVMLLLRRYCKLFLNVALLGTVYSQPCKQELLSLVRILLPHGVVSR